MLEKSLSFGTYIGLEGGEKIVRTIYINKMPDSRGKYIIMYAVNS